MNGESKHLTGSLSERMSAGLKSWGHLGMILLQEGRLVTRGVRDWSRAHPSLVWSSAIGIALLCISYSAILKFRSLKYLVGLIVLGAAVTAFLLLRRRRLSLLAAAGFSLPFHIQLNVMQRDQETLCVTGVSILILTLGVVLLGTRSEASEPLRCEISVTVPALLCTGADALSMVTTSDRTLTIMALLRDLEMVVLFLILVNAMATKEHLIAFLQGFYIGFGAECAIYVIQNIVGVSFDVLGNTKYVGSTDVDTGYIGSQRGTFDAAPAVAALYFSLMALSLMGVYLCRRKLGVRLQPVIGIVMGVGCLALSAKRAPLSGFALALCVLTYMIYKMSPDAVGKLARVLIALAIPLLVCAPVLLLRAQANVQAAYEERMNLTRVAWEMWETHPLVGVGYGTYDSVKREYLPEDWSGWLYEVHNNYLGVLAETGIVGLSMLLVLYVSVLLAAYRGIKAIAPEFRPLQVSLLAGFVAIYWEMYWDIFNSRQQLYIMWYLTALVVVLPRILRKDLASEQA